LLRVPVSMRAVVALVSDSKAIRATFTVGIYAALALLNAALRAADASSC
jgi:hypothetical protein